MVRAEQRREMMHGLLDVKNKNAKTLANIARLSIDTYHAPLGLACKDTPLQIVETRSIIEGTNLLNSIPNRANGSTCKPICRSQIEDKFHATAARNRGGAHEHREGATDWSEGRMRIESDPMT